MRLGSTGEPLTWYSSKPAKCGPLIFQSSRLPSEVMTNAPLRVPTSTLTLLIVLLLSKFGLGLGVRADSCYASAGLAAIESGEDWCGVSLLPAAAGFGEDLFAVVRHVGDDRTGRSGVLVACAPDEQLEEHGSEVDALLGEAVVDSAGVSCLRLGEDDARGFELLQAVGEDVGGYAFACLLELLERAVAADHHVADDEQRPAVSQHFEGDADRAAGSALGIGSLLHARHAIKYCLQCASNILQRRRTKQIPTG